MNKRKPLPKIQSWADIPDSAFNVFTCSGCGGEDITMWEKDGLEHWSQKPGPDRICGYYRFTRPAVANAFLAGLPTGTVLEVRERTGFAEPYAELVQALKIKR